MFELMIKFEVGEFGNIELIVTTQGNHKELPLHQKIFLRLHKNIVVGAILYGCPE
ncbi:MAG: hypothetical protein KAI83_14140 [Thiomargarita sp.]|nr:hypothetical protein [Thiomargarita sp.]